MCIYDDYKTEDIYFALRLAQCNLVYTYCKVYAERLFLTYHSWLLSQMFECFCSLAFVSRGGLMFVFFFKEGIYILYKKFALKFIF